MYRPLSTNPRTSWGDEKHALVSSVLYVSEQVSSFQIAKVLSTVSLFFNPEQEHLTSLQVIVKIRRWLSWVGLEARLPNQCTEPSGNPCVFSFPHSPVTSPCLSKHQGRTSISRFSWWTTSTALGSGASTPWTSWWSTTRRPPSSPASTGRSSTSSGRCSDAPGRRPGRALLQALFSPPGPLFVQVGYLPPAPLFAIPGPPGWFS